MNEFIKLFGDITLLNVIEIALSFSFAYFVYKKVQKHFVTIHDAERERDEKLNEALEAVRKYPEYRQQSLEIQKAFDTEIQLLKAMHEDTSARLIKMEEDTKRRERNKLRDRLLQSYRYYTNKDTNPSQSWNKLEEETFWDMFKDYEEAGGDGYMHTEVQPAMVKLKVVELGE